MAIRETSPSGPVFVEPSLPFLQLSWLRLTAATEHTVAGYQDDGYFGLCLVDRGAPAPEDAEGIYRWRELPLPVGRVDAVRVVAGRQRHRTSRAAGARARRRDRAGARGP